MAINTASTDPKEKVKNPVLPDLSIFFLLSAHAEVRRINLDVAASRSFEPCCTYAKQQSHRYHVEANPNEGSAGQGPENGEGICFSFQHSEGTAKKCERECPNS